MAGGEPLPVFWERLQDDWSAAAVMQMQHRRGL